MANVWDANTKGVWNMDNGAIVTDSSGNGETMTNNNGVTADTGDFKQGDASGVFVAASSRHLSRLDSALASGFPLKSGETNRDFSVFAWFKANDASATDVIASKRESGKISMGVQITSSHVRFFVGTVGGSGVANADDTSTSLVDGQWYHVGATYTESDDAWRIRIWDDTAQSVGETTGTFSVTDIAITDASFKIGLLQGTTTWAWDGLIDEVVVWDRPASAAEIDEVRQGIYGAPTFVTKTYTADAHIAKTSTDTYTADANIAVVVPDSYTADANISASPAKTYTADANIVTRANKTYTADCHIDIDQSGNFPQSRPPAFDADKLWDEETKTWYATSTVTGARRLKQAGGRYGRQLVVLSDQGFIYYGAI